MNNKLIPTNGLWFKIKKILRKIFVRKKLYDINETKIDSELNNKFVSVDNLKDKLKKENETKNLSEKLLLGELGTSELDEKEVDEMTEYFTKDIQNIDNELIIIKKHILAMQQELNK
jgi:hypothetical protein